MELKDRIKRAASYKDTDFFQADSIGVLARGPSLYRLDLCYKKFSHCYLAGEFNSSLGKIRKYLLNKDIVLCVMQQDRYRTSPENCKKFNIKNIQIRFQEDTERYAYYVNKFPDLKVVGCTKENYEILESISDERRVFSTGLAAVFCALFFSPKDIYIIGVDFYNKNVKPYFAREEHDLPIKGVMNHSASKLRPGMIIELKRMCEAFPDTNFHLYTTYKGIKSVNNLYVRYV